MHFRNPVVQAVHNKGLHDRMIAIDGIATSRIIPVIPAVIFKYIVDCVIKAAERKSRAEFTSFRRMVKYNIQNDFYSVLMQFPYHPFKFRYGLRTFAASGV